MSEFIKKIIDFNYRFTIKPKLVIPIVLLIIANLVLLKYSSVEKSFLFYDQIQWIIIGGIAFILFSYIRIDFIFQHSFSLIKIARLGGYAKQGGGPKPRVKKRHFHTDLRMARSHQPEIY